MNDRQSVEFLHRSYASVDGLWFMKVEEKYGFQAALDIDNEVWKVMPKIQARMLKSLGERERGIEALFECFTTKLTLDGFTFKAEKSGEGSGFRIIVEKCPWYNLLVKAGRTNIAGELGTIICNTEYSGWASEFGEDIRFTLQHQICRGAECCLLEFISSSA